MVSELQRKTKCIFIGGSVFQNYQSWVKILPLNLPSKPRKNEITFVYKETIVNKLKKKKIFINRMTLGKSSNYSEPQFPPKLTGNDRSNFFVQVCYEN